MVVQTYDLDSYQETFAAWLDGMLPSDDEDAFNSLFSTNMDLQELLDANDQIDESFEQMIDNGYELPEELSMDFELPQIDSDFDEEVLPYDEDSYEEFEDNSDSLSEDEPNENVSDSFFEEDLDLL